jgi:F-type H+-transporting ATPase subunit b
VNLNLTLIGQLIAFTIFVIFCMKYVWPPISGALADRQKKIAEGLDAADKAARDLETAKSQIEDELKQARSQVTELLEQANKRSSQIVEEAQDKAARKPRRSWLQHKRKLPRMLLKHGKRFALMSLNLPLLALSEC